MNDLNKLDFGGLFEEPRPVSGVIVHKVQVTLGEMFADMAMFEEMEMKRAVRFQTNIKLPQVEDIERYLKTLIWIRSTQTTEPRALKDYRAAIYSARVPARLAVIMDNLGEAFDHGANIRFIPVCEISSEDLVSPEEIITISNIMEGILAEGYQTVVGIKKDKQGSVDLMSKLVLATPESAARVLSYRKDNPVYAFFAAILQLEIIDLAYEDLRLSYRVQYSDQELYRSRYNQYYREMDKTGNNSRSDEE